MDNKPHHCLKCGRDYFCANPANCSFKHNVPDCPKCCSFRQVGNLFNGHPGSEPLPVEQRAW